VNNARAEQQQAVETLPASENLAWEATAHKNQSQKTSQAAEKAQP